MIDIRKLKELVRLMVENDLTELDLRDSEEQVTMRRPNPMGMPQFVATPGQMLPAASGGTPVLVAPTRTLPGGNGAATAHAAAGELSTEDDSSLVKIESPMVGTFYATPNPDSPPFVNVGTPVAPDRVVCIIEAMKIFNEIKAECTGVIHKVLVKSGDPVEFGQPLFLVKPA
jgi:acetyl-CoA carboxylase biotin carboxyl carrier protein